MSAKSPHLGRPRMNEDDIRSLEDINDRGLVWLRSDGAIVMDSRLREYPTIIWDRLHTAVEDNIVEEDGVEDINWHGVFGDYEALTHSRKGIENEG